MRILILTSLITCCSILVHGQNATGYYGNSATKVYSVDKLPSIIQLKLNSILSASFGELEPSVQFNNARIIDIDQFFKENNVRNTGWLAPKYDVCYYISIPSRGMKKFNLNIMLDQYGQLMSINWPEKGNTPY